jgi:hypothetical protein
MFAKTKQAMEQQAENFVVPAHLRQKIMAIPHRGKGLASHSYISLIAASLFVMIGFIFYLNQSADDIVFVEGVIDPTAIVIIALEN